MTTETRAKVHVVLGRLIVALQYVGRTNLAGHLTPQPAFGTAKTLNHIASIVPRDGRNAYVGRGLRLCSNCHESGRDYLRSEFRPGAAETTRSE